MIAVSDRRGVHLLQGTGGGTHPAGCAFCGAFAVSAFGTPNDKRFLFEKGRVKDSLVDALKRAAEFSWIALCFAVPKGSGRSQVSENMVKYHCSLAGGEGMVKYV